jgi:cyclomaltodextrinase / maltogenic alpha-amylase / neopullulanase
MRRLLRSINLLITKIEMKKLYTIIISFVICQFLFISCSHQAANKEWIKNAVIYEVNLKMYSPDGTIKTFQKELPRLQKMGVDVLWIMPIHSQFPYAPDDYFGIDKSYGTKEDFKALVDDIHSRNMKVILDEVPNHCGWSNKIITEHPEYFVHDSLGKICYAYVWKWMAQFDYSKKETRDFMLSVMKYWVEEFDVDGYRMDCSWAPPLDFWEYAIPELNKVKPVLMLAEAEGPQYHRAGFDMTYQWNFMMLRGDIMNHVKNAWDLGNMMVTELNDYQKNDIRMYFTSNHDEDRPGWSQEADDKFLLSWRNPQPDTITPYIPKGFSGLPGIARRTGRSFSRLKGATKAFAVATFTLPGMPLIYNGQETAYESGSGLPDDKEYIDFKNHDMTDFYTSLISMKHENQALWNGIYGGDYERLENGADSSVFSFMRIKESNKVLTIINFTDQVQPISVSSDKLDGSFIDLFKDGYSLDNLNGKSLVLEPYEFRIFISK